MHSVHGNLSNSFLDVFLHVGAANRKVSELVGPELGVFSGLVLTTETEAGALLPAAVVGARRGLGVLQENTIPELDEIPTSSEHCKVSTQLLAPKLTVGDLHSGE